MTTLNAYKPLAFTFSALAASVAANAANADETDKVRPNVILLVADDLGYGDLECYGAKNVETPNVNALAATGIRFTNCHAVAATSTPSRYSLLTGEYAWRRGSETNVAAGNAGSIIKPEQYTMADMFHDAGYATGAIGKWHLGLGSATGGQDWNGVIDVTPRDLGFDYHYIQAATADRVPCVYLEQDTVANYDASAPIYVSYSSNFEGEPTGASNPEMLKLLPSHGHNQSIVDSISRIGYMKGGGTALWKDENIADSIVAHSIGFMREHKDEPFFLYLCTNDVHVPRWPHARFRGKNSMGLRGDAIVQFDWTVGQITAALEELGLTENTLIILTSDNGPIHDDGYADNAVELLNGHSPTGGRRGMKYSGYEGGTLVPCIVSWPARVSAVTEKNNTLMSQIDFFASLGSLIDAELPEDAAPDSGDRMAQLLGESMEHRPWVSEEPNAGPLTVRTAKWKYITASSYGEYITWGPPEVETGNKSYEQLFDMENDPCETTNLAELYPDTVKMMKRIFRDANYIDFPEPDYSDEKESHWYTISASLLGKYCLSIADDTIPAAVGSDYSILARSQWKFVARGDGTCDVVNRLTGAYIDPASAGDGEFFKFSNERPENGWLIDYGSTKGYVVFYNVDGITAQMTVSADDNYALVNSGEGSNSGTACQFILTEVTEEPVLEVFLPDDLATPTVSTATSPFWYTILARRRNSHYIADGKEGVVETMQSEYYRPELVWRIESRSDDGCNIVNLATGNYLNPALVEDTGELTVTAEAPETGWSIELALSSTVYVIYSGDVQASVSSDDYKCIDYGESSISKSSGCQFCFIDVTSLVQTYTTGITTPVAAPERPDDGVLYDLHGRRVVSPRHGIYLNSSGKRIVY